MGNKLTVLVVDDEPVVLSLTAKILEREEFIVVTAVSAQQALQLCEDLAGELALVVSDVSMPGMNGIDLAECIRKSPTQVPVILMSGFASADHLFQDLEDARLGGVRFLAKPFKVQDLREQVSAALKET